MRAFSRSVRLFAALSTLCQVTDGGIVWCLQYSWSIWIFIPISCLSQNEVRPFSMATLNHDKYVVEYLSMYLRVYRTQVSQVIRWSIILGYLQCFDR